ncbi:E3 ubiquitin-protein ligase BRE1 [Cytospora mali]|uniref:E3 ubiquitin protein ligase n=1 Tax=Cytospora mali TaxID=578113 RepID=A0A194VKQ4_CYTMA|nr:E3 ubiquitin-protein ligase BRE1 [Valsa mali]
MPVATSPSAALPTSPIVKMEDRKRPAINSAEDLAPPSKRHQVNGSSKSRDHAVDMGDEAWIEAFQKDAIHRQMLEYKREKVQLENRLDDLRSKYEHYDDHMRIIDAWWLQLLQEVQLLAESSFTDKFEGEGLSPSTGLGFKDSQFFQNHLADKGNAIQSIIKPLFDRLAAQRGAVKPELAELEAKIKHLLATQKEYKVQLEGLAQKKEELSVNLDAAMLRVVKAEKKLDRAKSAQVQKLEQQAFASSTGRSASNAGENGKDSGNEVGETNGHDESLHLKYKEAVAEMTKQKEQLDSAISELKSLKEENSSLKIRRDSVTDEDYVRTDVFKAFKNQNEDLIKRINDLEATNKQLRLEAERLQAERTSFRSQLEHEAQDVTSELEEQIQAKEADLTRVRSQRDELLAEKGILKASQEQERSSFESLKELVGAKEDRILALEMELERLRPSADAAMSEPRPDLESITVEELRAKFLKLEKDFRSINQELPSMEKAYRRSAAISQKKVMDQNAAEERIAILTQEKSKADQKYFAARKDADIRNNEIRTLRQQNGKSSEIIASLKEHDTQARTLVSNLEKQLTDLQRSNTAIMEENRALKVSSAEAIKRSEHVKSQIADLQNLVKTKDTMSVEKLEQANRHETDAERLKVRLEHVQKDRDTWKKKALGKVSEEEDVLRRIALCSVCQNNPKDCMLKTCNHFFCKECAEARLTNRMRKCPTCSRAYDRPDIVQIYLSN